MIKRYGGTADFGVCSRVNKLSVGGVDERVLVWSGFGS
jgi:hypothetical protein